jgi:hypothetical protein
MPFTEAGAMLRLSENLNWRLVMHPVLAMTTIGWLILVVIWVALAFWPARVAGRKGHSFIGFFIFSLFFFPASLLVAYLVQDRTAPGPR